LVVSLESVAEFVYTVVLKPAPLRSFANSIIRALIPKTLNIENIRLALNPNDPVVSGALTLRVYERSETALFQSLCRPGMTVLDIGANVGYYTALAIKGTARLGRIISLEPDPDSFRYLQQTVAANGGTNVTCVNCAAAEQAGESLLFVSRHNRGDSRLYSNDLATHSVVVRTVIVDELLNELGISEVDLIKIDVQGYESRVFSGMQNILRNSPSITVLSEFWPQGLRSAGSDPEEFLCFLEEQDLRLYQLNHAGSLIRLTDKEGLIREHEGRKYTNIVGTKLTDLPGVIRDDRTGRRRSVLQ
jgi:FkbM family methyltransferase